jgi:hypothetical protein
LATGAESSLLALTARFHSSVTIFKEFQKIQYKRFKAIKNGRKNKYVGEFASYNLS